MGEHVERNGTREKTGPGDRKAKEMGIVTQKKRKYQGGDKRSLKLKRVAKGRRKMRKDGPPIVPEWGFFRNKMY